jgi:hypothetical protein
MREYDSFRIAEKIATRMRLVSKKFADRKQDRMEKARMAKSFFLRHSVFSLNILKIHFAILAGIKVIKGKLFYFGAISFEF